MKLCIIDPVGNLGGGSRFLRCLVPALLERRPELNLRLLAPRALFAREDWKALSGPHGVELVELVSTRWAQEGMLGFPSTAAGVRYAQGRFQGWLGKMPGRISGNFQNEIRRKSAGSDAVFFPWPFLFSLPALECPAAAVFHDFNYKYFFGGFSALFPWQREIVERETPRWLAGTHPVVTSDFMAAELGRFYPACREKATMIRMPPMIPPLAPATDGQPAEEIVRRLGIPSPFVLYPCNLHAHKNIGPLIAAMALLAEKGPSACLVLTGPYTEQVRGEACRIGAVRDAGPANVIGLGYVSHRDMEALMAAAAAVVSSSLYEAGNGPGLEGWAKGRPVAMSDIPSFVEHMKVWGVHAELFDPRSPESIAAALSRILLDPGKALALVKESQERISANTWARAADQYLSLFDRMTKENTP